MDSSSSMIQKLEPVKLVNNKGDESIKLEITIDDKFVEKYLNIIRKSKRIREESTVGPADLSQAYFAKIE